jgi:hypothetical protein
MCLALRDEGNSWRVNPMFIEPMAAAAAPYPCTSGACVDAAGAPTPCTDDAGAAIPDQPPPR